MFELSFGPSSRLDVIPGFVKTTGSRFFHRFSFLLFTRSYAVALVLACIVLVIFTHCFASPSFDTAYFKYTEERTRKECVKN